MRRGCRSGYGLQIAGAPGCQAMIWSVRRSRFVTRRLPAACSARKRPGPVVSTLIVPKSFASPARRQVSPPHQATTPAAPPEGAQLAADARSGTCAGTNGCGGTQCPNSSPGCFCRVDAQTSAYLCAGAAYDGLNCEQCGPTETCVDLSACGGAGAVGCAVTCTWPRCSRTEAACNAKAGPYRRTVPPCYTRSLERCPSG